MLQLMRRFQPKLRSFEWPDAQDFPHVTRRWPDEKQLRRQYLVFWTILHRRSHLHHDWLHVQRCKVSFVSPPSFLMHVLSVCWHGAASGNTLDCLSDLVWRFLARDDASFHVEATSLGPCSCNMSGILRPGHFCEVLRPRCIQGRAVYVLSVEGHANAEAIAATVMLDKSYHLYTSSKVGKTTHAWHIAFLLCLCVSTQSASSSCERIGSFLHNLEEGESRISAARIADRLRLKVAGVEAIGGERDELLVSNIVETISSSKSPLIQKSAMAKRRKKGQDATGSLSLVHRLAKSNEKAETSMIPSASLHREPGVIEDSLDFLYLVWGLLSVLRVLPPTTLFKSFCAIVCLTASQHKVSELQIRAPQPQRLSCPMRARCRHAECTPPRYLQETRLFAHQSSARSSGPKRSPEVNLANTDGRVASVS